MIARDGVRDLVITVFHAWRELANQNSHVCHPCMFTDFFSFFLVTNVIREKSQFTYDRFITDLSNHDSTRLSFFFVNSREFTYWISEFTFFRLQTSDITIIHLTFMKIRETQWKMREWKVISKNSRITITSVKIFWTVNVNHWWHSWQTEPWRERLPTKRTVTWNDFESRTPSLVLTNDSSPSSSIFIRTKGNM